MDKQKGLQGDSEVEIWKDVPGWHGKYQASNLGRIKSLPRQENSKRRFITFERILTPNIGKYGYARVIFDNKRKYLIHRLVALAFIPNPENKPQVNHIDGNKENNSLHNLEWSTASENMRHAHAKGLASSLKGDEAPWSKLTKEDVYAIRLAHSAGMRQIDIHKRYYGHLSIGAIHDVVKRNRWKHI